MCHVPYFIDDRGRGVIAQSDQTTGVSEADWILHCRRHQTTCYRYETERHRRPALSRALEPRGDRIAYGRIGAELRINLCKKGCEDKSLRSCGDARRARASGKGRQNLRLMVPNRGASGMENLPYSPSRCCHKHLNTTFAKRSAFFANVQRCKMSTMPT